MSSKSIMMASLALFVLSVCASVCGQELLQNSGMEDTHLSHWHCNGCTMTSSTDAHSGGHSVLVTHRHSTYNTIAQNVNVTPGKRYLLKANIKLQQTHTGSQFYTQVDALIKCGTLPAARFGRDKYVEAHKWTLIGGVLSIPAGYHNCHVAFFVTGPEVNYLLDDVSLTEIPDNSNWRTEANQRIDQLRKSPITVNLNGAQASDVYTIELTQTKHQFAFGSAVGAKQMVDPTLTHYQKGFYENFEWSVLENALKWDQLERHQGHVDFSTADAAIHALKSHGVPVRAHNIFWATDSHVPNWVKAQSGSQLQSTMDKHLTEVVTHTRGMVEHWDVNNEDIHGKWYEEATHDTAITQKMFTQTHAIDGNVKLFLNDFSVMEQDDAIPLLNQAKTFKNAHVPIYGVGIQSHLHNIANLDIEAMQARLDIVAEAGLPIWITELSFGNSDENVKANALQDVLTLYFSHPSVEGVLFWGFWDGKIFDPKTALFEGPNVTPNAAGRAYQQLFKTTWRTHATRTLHGNDSFSLRGFKGTYSVSVKHNGREIKQETIVVGDGHKNVDITIGSGGSIIVG